MKGTRLYLPIPKDLLARKVGEKIVAVPLRPVAMRDGECCDLPRESLLPAMLPEAIEEFKPEQIPAFWSIVKMTEWLTNPDGSDFPLYPDSDANKNKGEIGQECKKEYSDFLDAPEKDERVHAGIDSESGVAEDGLLFMSIGLDLATHCQGREILLAARIESDGIFDKQIRELNEIHPFGGERRLVQWSRIDESIGWKCPNKISSKLTELDSGKIRMVLATPAIFSNGWLPGWLNLRKQEDGKEILEGIPPRATDGQKLKLISACIDRWKPISGWSAEAKSRGPKAIRRMVPAGSVYFFEAQSGNEASALAKSHWLESVCDKPQDCKDGFGLAVWGVWEETKKEDNKDRK
jgi:CRISPR-associated protein Cmr3